MIVMIGECSECKDGKEKRLAKRKPALCGYHYSIQQRVKAIEKNKDKPTKARTPIKRTKLSIIRKKTGELEMFNEIWDERPHFSFLNDEPLPYFHVSLFAHVLSKAENKFPKFKLYKPCVILLTFDQHRQLDFSPRSELELLPEWKKVFELEEKLKQEYKEKFGTRRESNS